MSVHVIIPWRDDGNDIRRRSRDWVLAMWAAEYPGWPVHIGEVTGDWCKADAVAAARQQIDEPDAILIIADADVWAPAVSDAVWHVLHDDYRWAVPHSAVHRLSEHHTRRVLDGHARYNECVAGCLDRGSYLGVVGGGMTVIRADLYDDVPLDPRFVGWGQEDEAWGHALHTLGGRRWRSHQPLWHLWHPPQDRMSRAVGSVHGQRLRDQYRGYVTRPDMMRQLISGGRRHQAT